MDYLTLVQSLHYEAKLPGSPPSTVAGQSGRAADLVRWVAEAWNDIQRDSDGQWKWMLGNWTVDTAADDADYAFGEVTDVEDAAGITRFRGWELDEEMPPLIYLTSDGKSTERELPIWHWNDFRYLYVRGTHESAEPSVMSVDLADKLFFGPTPNDIYTVTGNYWKSNQTLTDDDDEPEMPVDYHFLIVYRAIIKYAYNIVGHEILARARTEGTPLYDGLVGNQWYGRDRIHWPAALA